MKASEIYREAAKLMESGEGPSYSCWAINNVATQGEWNSGYVPDRRGDFRIRYERLMLDSVVDTFASRNERVLALAFMAAVTEDEERAARRRSK